MSRRLDPINEKWIEGSEATIHKDGYIISYRKLKPERIKQRKGREGVYSFHIRGRQRDRRIHILMEQYWDIPNKVTPQQKSTKNWVNEKEALEDYKIDYHTLRSKIERRQEHARLYSRLELEYWKKHGKVPKIPLDSDIPKSGLKNFHTGFPAISRASVSSIVYDYKFLNE